VNKRLLKELAEGGQDDERKKDTKETGDETKANPNLENQATFGEREGKLLTARL